MKQLVFFIAFAMPLVRLCYAFAMPQGKQYAWHSHSKGVLVPKLFKRKLPPGINLWLTQTAVAGILK